MYNMNGVRPDWKNPLEQGYQNQIAPRAKWGLAK